MIDPCPLCQALTHAGSQRIENTPLYETRNFVVMPTLGQFIQGWLMVVSKHHCSCARSLDRELLEELNHVVQLTRDAINCAYGPSIVFEHGPGKSRHITGGCCIQHTHVHVAPCKSPERFRSLLPFPIAARCHLLNLAEHDEFGYLLVGSEGEDTTYDLYPINTVIPRQFLRQVLSVAEDKCSMWDWRRYPCRENIQQSVNVLERAFGGTMRPGATMETPQRELLLSVKGIWEGVR